MWHPAASLSSHVDLSSVWRSVDAASKPHSSHTAAHTAVGGSLVAGGIDDSAFLNGRTLTPSTGVDLCLRSPSSMLASDTRLARGAARQAVKKRQAEDRIRRAQVAEAQREINNKENIQQQQLHKAVGVSIEASVPSQIASTIGATVHPASSAASTLTPGLSPHATPNVTSNYLSALSKAERKALYENRYLGKMWYVRPVLGGVPASEVQNRDPLAVAAEMYYKATLATGGVKVDADDEETKRPHTSERNVRRHTFAPDTRSRPGTGVDHHGRHQFRTPQYEFADAASQSNEARTVSSRPMTTGDRNRVIRSVDLGPSPSDSTATAASAHRPATAGSTATPPIDGLNMADATTRPFISPVTSTAHWSNRIYHPPVRPNSSVHPTSSKIDDGRDLAHHRYVGIMKGRNSTKLQLAKSSHFRNDVRLKEEPLTSQAQVKCYEAALQAESEARDDARRSTGGAGGEEDGTQQHVNATDTSIAPPPLPRQQKLEKRFDEQGTKFLTNFSQTLSHEFDTLIGDARFHSYDSMSTSEVALQKLNLVKFELSKRCQPHVHDLVHSLKVEALKESRSERSKHQRKEERCQRKHWKTGELMTPDPMMMKYVTAMIIEKEKKKHGFDVTEAITAAAKGEPDGESQLDPSLVQLRASYVQHYLELAASEEREAALRRRQQAAELKARELRERQARGETITNAEEGETELEPESIDTPSALELALRDGLSSHNDGLHGPSHSVGPSSSGPMNGQPVSNRLAAFDRHLESIHATPLFMKQDLADTTSVKSQSAIQAQVEERRRRKMAQRQMRRERHAKRRGVFVEERKVVDDWSDPVGTIDGGSDSSSSLDSVCPDSDTDVGPIVPTVRPASPPPPAILDAAMKESQPIVAILKMHDDYEASQRLLDHTDEVMRRHRALESATDKTVHALEAKNRIKLALEQREKDMVALVRHEHNQKALRATRRSMVRSGRLSLTLYSVSDLIGVLPPGHLGRFEIALTYTSPNLPTIFAHTLPFSQSTSNMIEIFQTIDLPILNVHVQRIRVTLQVMTPKYLLKWLFQHRHTLFGTTASSNNGSTPKNPIDYIKYCEAELQMMTIPPERPLTSSRPNTGRTVMATRPKSSQSLRPSPRTARVSLGGDAADSPFHEYQAGLSAWFHQGQDHTGAPPPNGIPTRPPRPPASALPTRRAQAVLHHALAAKENAQTFSSWIAAMRVRLNAWRQTESLSSVDADGAILIDSDSVSSSIVPPNASSRRLHSILGWSRNQVFEFLNGIGLSETLIFKKQTLDGKQMLESQNELERMAANQIQAQKEERQTTKTDFTKSPTHTVRQVTHGSSPQPPPLHPARRLNDVDAYALASGNAQRSLDALKLVRSLQFLVGRSSFGSSQNVLTLGPNFDFEQFSFLRTLVFEAYETVENMPEHVTRVRAAAEAKLAAETTASLTEDEQAHLSARLTEFNNRQSERHAAELAAFTHSSGGTILPAPPAASSHPHARQQQQSRKVAEHIDILRQSQLRTMERIETKEIQQWRLKNQQMNQTQPTPTSSQTETVELSDQALSSSYESNDDDDLNQLDGGDDERVSRSVSRGDRPLLIRDGARTDSSLMLHRPNTRPATRVESRTGPHSHVHAAHRSSVDPSSSTGVVVVGQFDLLIRRIARCEDGLFRGKMKLSRPSMESNNKQTLTNDKQNETHINGATDSLSTSNARSSSSHAHYRAGLSTPLHSGSARTFLPGSASASIVQTPRVVVASTSTVGSLSVSVAPPVRPKSSPQTQRVWLRANLERELHEDADRAAQQWRHKARVDILVQFTPEEEEDDDEQEYKIKQTSARSR